MQWYLPRNSVNDSVLRTKEIYDIANHNAINILYVETVKSQIDVDNSSNKMSYLCSNAKQTYVYMCLRNGLKIAK